ANSNGTGGAQSRTGARFDGPERSLYLRHDGRRDRAAFFKASNGDSGDFQIGTAFVGSVYVEFSERSLCRSGRRRDRLAIPARGAQTPLRRVSMETRRALTLAAASALRRDARSRSTRRTLCARTGSRRSVLPDGTGFREAG